MTRELTDGPNPLSSQRRLLRTALFFVFLVLTGLVVAIATQMAAKQEVVPSTIRFRTTHYVVERSESSAVPGTPEAAEVPSPLPCLSVEKLKAAGDWPLHQVGILTSSKEYRTEKEDAVVVDEGSGPGVFAVVPQVPDDEGWVGGLYVELASSCFTRYGLMGG